MSVGIDSLYGRLVDLHLHIDGSISVSAARRLAELGGAPLQMDDAALFDRLSVGDACEDLNEYLSKFVFPLSLLQTREQISEAVYLLQEDLIRLGYAYAELRFAPQSHCERGLSQEEVIQAAIEGLHRSAFEGRLILCCMRGADTHAANVETVELASRYLGRDVVAVDLAGAEALFPTSDYFQVFAHARELGVPITIHAGEADGPLSVRDALAMGAARIGHGVRAVADARLVRELAERRVPLELCVTSELQTGALFEGTSVESLQRLLDAGVVVTVNSDNCAVSDTWAGHEMVMLSEELDLDEVGVTRLLLNAVDASFADGDTKRWLRGVVLQGQKPR